VSCAGGGGGDNPERRKRSWRGIGHRRSNLAVNIIFYLCKINLFLLILE